VRRLVLVAPPPSLLDAQALEEFPRPILMIAGQSDAIAPPAPLEAIVASCKRATLEVIPDADHFFGIGLREISRAIASWFEAI
jgi:alpha/beta superfamily hydrolase